jgi:two-component system sensor histidine kinase BaeS
VGISAEDLPRLFDRYFQAQRARQRRSGLELGLFSTKGLVEAHGADADRRERAGAGQRLSRLVAGGAGRGGGAAGGGAGFVGGGGAVVLLAGLALEVLRGLRGGFAPSARASPLEWL